MDCTVEDVYIGVRSRLGDTARVGGEIFTNDQLRQPFIQAWNELVQERTSYQVPDVEKTAYLPVPAYTSELYPDVMGVLDIAEIQDQGVSERPAVEMRTITGATSTSPIQITVDTTGLQPGVPMIVCGVIGQSGANGRFFLDINGPTTATLRGSKSAGTYVSGGSLSIDTGVFTPCAEGRDLPRRAVAAKLGNYVFEGNRFQFVGANADVLLKVEYLSSLAPPASGYVGIDGSLNYLVTRTAAIAGSGKSNPDIRQKASTAPGRPSAIFIHWSRLRCANCSEPPIRGTSPRRALTRHSFPL
ncbi:MAG: hypothetical protein QM757_26415 [Paludibaculum sp.]